MERMDELFEKPWLKRVNIKLYLRYLKYYIWVANSHLHYTLIVHTAVGFHRFFRRIQVMLDCKKSTFIYIFNF